MCKKNKALLKNFTSCEFNHSHTIRRGDGSNHYKYCKEKQIHEGWLEWDNMCTKKGDTSLPKYKDIQIKFILLMCEVIYGWIYFVQSYLSLIRDGEIKISNFSY